MLQEWRAMPRFPDIVLSKRLLEAANDGEDEGEIVIDLFDQLKIDDDKLADEEDNFLLSAVSDQALILPFFSDEAVTISEVVLCPASDYCEFCFQNSSFIFTFRPSVRPCVVYKRDIPPYLHYMTF